MKAALASGEVTPDLVDRSVMRILYAMFEHGLFDFPTSDAPMRLSDDLLASGAEVTRQAAAESMVLLKNDRNILPLAADAKSIVVIGGHADRGVLAGGGSSLVYPVGGNAVPGLQPTTWPGPVMYYPSSPLEALRRRLPNANITFVDGKDAAAAAKAAGAGDMAIVFATQWTGESFDVPLTLPDDQDALIDRVAGANRNTVVVLETGGSVLTPWRTRVAGIVASWFPGTRGGEAIADVLTGAVNPSGHLPVSFIDKLTQLPHPQAPAKGEVRYTEGSVVGYRWLDSRKHKPAFPFGHGLSYSNFAFDGLNVQANGASVLARFRVTNSGGTAGKDVAQIYVSGPGLDAPMRLGGFQKLDLDPGESLDGAVTIDPRMFANFKRADGGWKVKGGTYRVHLAHSSRDIVSSVPVALPAMTLPMHR